MSKTSAARSAKRAGDAYGTARSNPYVQRLLEDEELRDNIRNAFEAARDAYQRMSNGKGPVKAIHDKRVKRDLRTAADSLREASEQIRGRRRRKRRGRLLVFALIGASAAVMFSEGARKKVLDALFGSEEEFEYTSSTSPAPETTAA